MGISFKNNLVISWRSVLLQIEEGQTTQWLKEKGQNDTQ
jgi:hypothetical protein